MTYPKLNNFNEMYTPPEAMKYITPFMPKDKVYWEACYGMGHMADELRRLSYDVVGHKDIDCLIDEPKEHWDIWITNPPFNGNKKFIRRAIELGKPFIFLIRLEHLGGVEACELLKNKDIKIVIPEKRINYLTPKSLRGEKVGGSPFHSIFLTYKVIESNNQIIYIN